ncbi:MAG TPA: hypothetical protein VFV47_15200 [Hyphomicrobiaceae bacterium]|nr:hypothetical protein [Hyphomicrobiaceae bacterium]
MSKTRLVIIAAAAGLVLAAAGVGAVWATRPVPQSVEITGISGNAGEWELAATLTRRGDSRELSGAVKITHVGWCIPDGGDQQKTGELSVKMARLTSAIEARLRVDGMECTYSGSLSDAYTGMMACPDRRPVPLLIWLR